MADERIYQDISKRTQGDIYIGVVGPVRTGKSTFIRKFIEIMVLPKIENVYIKARMKDELPQSGNGKMLMTMQPVFIPNEAIELPLQDGETIRLKLIDCAGYPIRGVLGLEENNTARMIQTPWSKKEIPFEEAARLGTQKVIGEHSTIGIVVTSDGSVTDFKREEYLDAEAQIINELKMLGKPFIVLMNTKTPSDVKIQNQCKTLESTYEIPVVPINIEQIEERDIQLLLEKVLGQFKLNTLKFQTPEWLGSLDDEHWLVKEIETCIAKQLPPTLKASEMQELSKTIEGTYIDQVITKQIEHGEGYGIIQILLKEGLFNRILAEQCGTTIKNDGHLLALMRELVAIKKDYDRFSDAIKSVYSTGYGMVPPLIDEMTLQEPEIIGYRDRFGVNLKANAPSIHMLRVDIQTTISPGVGTDQQSEKMIHNLIEGFEHDPTGLWQSNLFGRPLCELMQEGLSNKLMHMPPDTQEQIRNTLEKIINDGDGTMVCFLL